MDLILITGLLFIWNLIVIHFISKWIYEYFRRFKSIPAEYVGRKVVHILGGGVTALIIPAFYEGNYWIVTVSAFLLAGYIYFMRRWKLMYWFQVKENKFEVHFAIAYGFILLIGILIGDVWIGLVPMLFMSFGDSATGLVRAFTQKRQVKSWDGTIAMFCVCSIIGFWKFSFYGILISMVTSLVESIPGVDDNISVPLISASLVYLGKIMGS